ncbi:hypothetical protein SMSP2_02140 [Limihaloglobus sulfuriphilus]|uniref:Carbohydrate-binding domain-containing protein n=1 Tax=Limihaloglobus sulfuriphilus TaxID=1851148 RepID=A0A1Q2MHN0_9BACT|nr:hypothetical protein [Limihaloglobus sulfuriphilus]AQQ71762.1 hypothetical protein SMSP2_02140 [Limihaloglobus sulfuriphilus]
MARKTHLLCLFLSMAMLVSFAGAEIKTQWSGSLESYGADDSWQGAAAARKGFANYFYDCNFSVVEVQLDGTVWMDYSPAFAADSAGISQGIGAGVISSAYDSDELAFTLAVTIDDAGYPSASLSGVAFKAQWAGSDITGLRFNFDLSTTAIQKVWGDDFDSYTEEAFLGTTDSWSTGWEGYVNAEHTAARRAAVGRFAGQVWMRDDYYGGFPDDWQYLVKPCIPDKVDSHHKDGVELTDYIVRFNAAKRNADSLTKCNYYALARYNSINDHILFEVGWGPYSENYYAIMHDTEGDGVFDPAAPENYESRYLAAIDIDQPVYMTLKVEGADVTGVAEHNGGKAVMRYQTTLTAGEPGFGGEWRWGYMDALFDDFEVYTVAADEPLVCGDDGTYYFEADLNQDCSVGIDDFAMMAENWLKTR